MQQAIRLFVAGVAQNQLVVAVIREHVFVLVVYAPPWSVNLVLFVVVVVLR